jgi:hypothetical protein
MRKALMVLVFLCFAGVALAAPKWLATQFFSSQSVTTGRTILYDATIYFFGVTAGDRVLLKNGTSAAATAFFVFAAPAANGTFYFDPEKDITIDQGLYLEILKTGGTVGVGLTYQE